MQARYAFPLGTVEVASAWSSAEVRTAVRTLLEGRPLPEDPGARILIKPNLNNDLVALTGNSTDLRVLCALIEALQERGYRDLAVADGPNVGVERRGIDVFKRLRITGLRERYGVELIDLNRVEGRPVPMHGGAEPLVSRAVLDADFVITVPTIKTHAEMGLSICAKNWVGITRAQDKRQIHFDLARNIVALQETVPPDLCLVDGLVGMEGNGPGDGEPFRLGVLVVGESAWLTDLVVCALVGFPWRDVPYLRRACERGHFGETEADEVAATVPARHTIRPAPRRSRLAELSDRRSLSWLKKAVRPLTTRESFGKLAYRANIIQDVYSTEDDAVQRVVRAEQDCGTCRRCEELCPTGLTVEEIGVKTELPDCIGCLYCYFGCPKSVIDVEGELNALERQVARYKPRIERL